MDNTQLEEIKKGVQEIIDLITIKDTRAANNKLNLISEKLDDLIDHVDEDQAIREISKYQVLLNQLFKKINPEAEIL